MTGTDMTSNAPSTMALDHPGWLTNDGGRARRAFRTGDTLWAVICEPTDLGFKPIIELVASGTVTTLPVADWFDTSTLPTFFHTARPIHAGARTCRVRNPSLWDALIPPILRQRRTVVDAARQYRRLCLNHGSTVATTAGPAILPPSPEAVLALPDRAFTELGVRDKRERFRTAADAYLRQADYWGTLPPSALCTDLQAVPYIGTWTAGAIVADITNDYSHYAIPADIAYRHWQQHITTTETDQSQHDFVEAWATLSHKQRATLTVFLLAKQNKKTFTSPVTTTADSIPRRPLRVRASAGAVK